VINGMDQIAFFKRLKLLNHQQRKTASKSYGTSAASVLKNWTERLDNIVYS
jgi:hypothetical protein